MARQFTREQKIKVAKEAVEAGNASLVGRRYGIHGTVVARWARAYEQRGEAAFSDAKQAPSRQRDSSDYRAVMAENERLKRLLGEKELQIEILKDLVKKTERNCARR